MVCFEVRVNGQQLCTAGIGELGVLTAILAWVKRDPLACPKDLEQSEWSPEQLDLHVSGSKPCGDQGDEHLDWIERLPVSIGDEITIKILDRPSCDRPTRARMME